MSSKKTLFNEDWFKDPQFSSWIARSIHKDKARCKVCATAFLLGNMGKQALLSHARGKKHQKIIAVKSESQKAGTGLHNFLVPRSPKESRSVDIQESSTRNNDSPECSNPSPSSENLTVPPPPGEPPRNQPSSSQLSSYFSKEDVLSAEVLWAIKTLMAHYSSNSSAGTDKLFAKMFPDSQIAKQFQCGKTKCSYLINFGLAPYFKEKLMKKLQVPGTKYVISFDESLNKVLQKEQMDLIVRFWDKEKNKVSSRYLNSQFLGHTRAADLLQKFSEALGKLNLANLIQVSMDGPNTNWKFFDSFCSDRAQTDPDLPHLINVGSCGLHVVHGAFKYGVTATGWKLDSLLRSLYYMFSDSPARREEYETLTGSSIWPLSFCGTRWLEDVPVAERALLVWPLIEKYVRTTLSGPKSKIPVNRSFHNLKEHVLDPLSTAKLQFFITIAKVLTPFLKKFQSEEPMLPFMAEELYTILWTLLEKFINKSVLDEATTAAKLSKIDVLKKENILSPKKVDVGFACKILLQEAQTKKKASPLQVLEFQNECVVLLQKLTNKLLERCPLQYAIVRQLTCMDPRYMAKNPDSAISKCSGLLQQLISKKLESPDSCDNILQQYKAFITEVQKYHKDEFVAYNSEQGLDSFLYGCIGEKTEYSELWEAFKMLLILSHGQSCVERGFSDNKDILSNNMQDETLISYRISYDGIKNQDGPIEDSVTKELLVSCRHAHARYQSCLNQKKKTEEASQKEKRKKEVQEELQSSRKKKERLEKMVQELTKEADELATEAETKHKMDLLVKSNALRSKSREKRKEIEHEEKNIDGLQKKLKLM